VKLSLRHETLKGGNARADATNMSLWNRTRQTAAFEDTEAAADPEWPKEVVAVEPGQPVLYDQDA
jgi:hypothetical protein